jgi:hypothetical protein
MRVTMQPDGLGELLQWGYQTGTLEIGGRAILVLTGVPQPFFSLSHPTRDKVFHDHLRKEKHGGSRLGPCAGPNGIPAN